MSWSEFFNMGGYALYVWSSFGLMAILLVANVVLTLQRKSSVTTRLQRSIRQAEKRV